MPKKEKADAILDLKEKIGRSSALYFIDFTKVRANDFNALRRKLGDLKVAVQVVKNTLALRALTESGMPPEVESILKGPTSVVFAIEDPVAPARLIRDVARKLNSLKVKGAWLDGTIYPAAQFEFLAGLPTKAELRGQVVGMLQAPIYELVMGLDGMISELVWVLDQVKDKPRTEAAPAEIAEAS